MVSDSFICFDFGSHLFFYFCIYSPSRSISVFSALPLYHCVHGPRLTQEVASDAVLYALPSSVRVGGASDAGKWLLTAVSKLHSFFITLYHNCTSLWFLVFFMYMSILALNMWCFTTHLIAPEYDC